MFRSSIKSRRERKSNDMIIPAWSTQDGCKIRSQLVSIQALRAGIIFAYWVSLTFWWSVIEHCVQVTDMVHCLQHLHTGSPDSSNWLQVLVHWLIRGKEFQHHLYSILIKSLMNLKHSTFVFILICSFIRMRLWKLPPYFGMAPPNTNLDPPQSLTWHACYVNLLPFVCSV